MIIDSHAYCFEPLDSPRGYASGEEHLRWAQAANASHHQPAMRIPDGEIGPSDVLDPAGTHDIDNLPDLRFRVNKPRGRVVWNWEGQEFTKYFLPPNLRNSEFTPFSLDCEMHYAGVDAVLLHTDPSLVRDSSYLQEIVERFPGRMYSMAPVDEWRIIGETDAVIAETVRAIEEHGLHAVKFNPPLCYMTSDEAWDDGPYRPFWEAATGLGVPIFFTLGAGPDDLKGAKRTKSEEQRGYLDEHRTLMRWMERYPDAVCSLTHGFPWRTFLGDNQEAIELPDEIWEPFSNPNVSIEVCFPVRLGRYSSSILTARCGRRSGRDGRTHRPQQPHVGHGHAIPEPLLHLPAVASVDRGTVRRLGRPERRRPVADDGRDGRAGSGRGIAKLLRGGFRGREIPARGSGQGKSRTQIYNAAPRQPEMQAVKATARNPHAAGAANTSVIGDRRSATLVLAVGVACASEHKDKVTPLECNAKLIVRQLPHRPPLVCKRFEPNKIPYFPVYSRLA